jgi:TolB-like protein
MSDNPDKFTRFWQELKRRKVIYVITVYASAAFVIIELVGNVTGPLNLPERISTIAIIVLAFGFPIVVILSWIFDLTPKGMERTKPLSEVQEDERPVIQNRWKIATYVSIAVIVGLIVLNIFSLNKVSASLIQYGKSIAIMPFINDTPDQENVYFVNGAMESILNNLSTIKDLKVLPRRSVEQYRDKILPIPEIAAAQQVSYVLEGSMQKYQDQIRITLTLSDQNNSQLWSRQYDREIKRAEEYFAFWSEIAQMVAEELKVVITPEEKQRIEKIPTASLDAHMFYHRGMDIYEEWYRERSKDTTKLKKAENLFYAALEYDSTYAPAYTGLAWVVLDDTRKYGSDKIRGDSVLHLLNKALSYDDQWAEAYTIRRIC